MAPKPKKSAIESAKPRTSKPWLQKLAGRDGLGAYIQDPKSFPPSRVIYHNDGFVAIHDLYPKASVHTLLLPRGPQSLLHPFEAFEDTVFLATVQEEVRRLRQLVAKELQRIHGKFSAQEKARERVLNGEDEIISGQDLPSGRDWGKEVVAGIHAHPSMTHLHVHVMSRDHFSECLKHRKHYNSFATPFFVDINDFPLAQDDVRRHPGHEGYLNMNLICWRCGTDFGNNFGKAFSKLKPHLAEEFQAWRAE